MQNFSSGGKWNTQIPLKKETSYPIVVLRHRLFDILHNLYGDLDFTTGGNLLFILPVLSKGILDALPDHMFNTFLV